MRGLLPVVMVLGLSSSCALRPKYRDFVSSKTTSKDVALQVTDGAGAPLPNVKVELSEFKNRLQLTTGADGVVRLPVEKKYLDEDPVLVVQVPVGVQAFTVALAPPPPPAPEQAPATPVPADAPPAGVPPAVPVAPNPSSL
jgi:hypothetical protein